MSIVLVVLLVLAILYFRARKQKPTDDEEYPQWDPYDADIRNFYRKRER